MKRWSRCSPPTSMRTAPPRTPMTRPRSGAEGARCDARRRARCVARCRARGAAVLRAGRRARGRCRGACGSPGPGGPDGMAAGKERGGPLAVRPGPPDLRARGPRSVGCAGFGAWPRSISVRAARRMPWHASSKRWGRSPLTSRARIWRPSRAAGTLSLLNGQLEQAAPHLERALELAEALDLAEVFAEALTSKAMLLTYRNRLTESGILLEGAIAKALASDLPAPALRRTTALASCSSRPTDTARHSRPASQPRPGASQR